VNPPRAILGICDGHDSGAALVGPGGRCLFAVSEERLSRLKHQAGFPVRAVRLCAEAAAIHGLTIGAVAVAEREGRLAFRLLDPLYRRSRGAMGPLRRRSRLAEALQNRVRVPGEVAMSSALLASRLRDLGIRAPVQLVDHHACHAWTALAGRPGFLGLTLDAFGDRRSGGIWRLQDNRLHLLADLPAPRGIASLFGAVAEFLGYEPGDEGKVVALAADGDPGALGGLLDGFVDQTGALPALRRPIGALRSLGPHRRQDLAASLQALTERSVAEAALKALRRWGGDGLALAGGLFANVALNRELVHRTGRPAFVFPAMGDAGLCVGAAFAALAAAGGEPQSLLDARLGPAAARTAPSSPAELAAHLTGGGLVASCRGRLEFGPRALGARSLLFGADDPTRAAAVNRALGRDPVMPFGPVIPVEAAPRFLRGYGPELDPMTRFMTVAWPATEELVRVAPAAVHADGTARAQVLDEATDPDLHALLRALPEPVLVNTSLNRHGEPIAADRPQAASVAAAVGARLWG